MEKWSKPAGRVCVKGENTSTSIHQQKEFMSDILGIESFDQVLNRWRRVFEGGIQCKHIDPTAYAEANKEYGFRIHDNILAVMARAAYMGTRTKGGQTYLRFGVARRLKMIWSSYRSLIFTVEPDRTEPLAGDVVDEVSKDLNVIYFNVRGILDNCAWGMLHEIEYEGLDDINPMRVGLFSSIITNNGKFSPLHQMLNSLRGWSDDVKSRRDPVAHRIPLSIPPAVLKPEESDQYKELWEKYWEHINSKEFDEAEHVNVTMGSLGTFWPVFAHHPDMKPMPIYPTVPGDVHQILNICSYVLEFMEHPESSIMEI